MKILIKMINKKTTVYLNGVKYMSWFEYRQSLKNVIKTLNYLSGVKK